MKHRWEQNVQAEDTLISDPVAPWQTLNMNNNQRTQLKKWQLYSVCVCVCRSIRVCAREKLHICVLAGCVLTCVTRVQRCHQTPEVCDCGNSSPVAVFVRTAVTHLSPLSSAARLCPHRRSGASERIRRRRSLHVWWCLMRVYWHTSTCHRCVCCSGFLLSHASLHSGFSWQFWGRCRSNVEKHVLYIYSDQISSQILRWEVFIVLHLISFRWRFRLQPAMFRKINRVYSVTNPNNNAPLQYTSVG